MFRLACKYFGYRYRQQKRKTSEKIVVETVYGPVRGVKRISCWDDPYYSFEKIPFAKPPVGELRFTDPVPPDPWVEPKKCEREPPMPTQFNMVLRVVHGTENCLFLNVYTPEIKPSELKPVMVWIYGGGFEMGGANRMMYGPDYLIQKDVVVVTINYRVGPQGFLSLKDPKLKVPGNAGLKDQILGLRWVNANIKNFGGDPGNVTLFGESAGGASTHYLMLTEQTKGLFHKAILMSGCALSPWACNTSSDNKFAYRLAKKLGYREENNDEKVLNFLKKRRGSHLAGVRLLTKEEKREGVLFAHGPVVEPYISEQCVVPKDPLLMAREAWSNEIPVIMGGCSNEGYVFHIVAKKLNIKKEVGDCRALVPKFPTDVKNEGFQHDHLILKHLYFGSKEPTLFPLLELMAHKNFWQPIRRTLRSRLTYSTAPTYLYRFDVNSDFNVMRQIMCSNQVNEGTCHGDDILYLFFGVLTSPISRDSMEYRAIQRFVGMFTQFSKTGNPNIPDIAPVVWEPAEKSELPVRCLNISENVTVMELPDQKCLDVWDSFFPKDKLI